ncbi:S8/S53 family peptidase [Dictyobacter arantiisoli]|uniref:Peptidase S8/S53 domain-containing protein n=1 Tax=Dictyobacter arantiisoli TaxID=2014874 RepID=A0A5A5TCV5_9CHLR|nr:S8/S53 family peptidase [Dictyobacter arantiisoli]GCF09177.1 hypothetical protein KDI_27410 [Dictyobacter arantiisoli]
MQSRSSTEFMGTPAGWFHWIPGEMIVVVRLTRIPLDNVLDTVVEQIRIQLNTFLARYHFALDAYGTAGRWSESPTMPPVRRRAFVFGLHQKQPLLAVFFHTRHRDEQQKDPLPAALSYIHAHLEYFAQQGLHILSAMPNWIVTAAPFFYGAGGPASPPRPAPSVEVQSPPQAMPGWHLKFSPPPGLTLDAQDAEDVLVVVLDTAHHPDRIRSAATRPELRRNWLLQQLVNDMRQEDGSFVVEYDRYALTNDVRTGHDISQQARYYLMPDHGLFVSGIIRDLAPRAQIRLVRALNDFGGNDLYSFYAILTDLEHELVSGTIRRLVINLSLNIMPDIRRLPYLWFQERQWPTSQLIGVQRALGQIEEGLRLLFESLAAHGALVVAAAGNDSTLALQQELPPRPPRAPARYSSTLAVTSVNSNLLPSNFANAANLAPSTSGVATFGGDGPGVEDKNGLPDAVRGVFISPTFPSGALNNTGWADWSGTSFATPMMSALGAHLMAQGWSAANIIARLSSGQEQHSDLLSGIPPAVPSLLANIISVRQHFGL